MKLKLSDLFITLCCMMLVFKTAAQEEDSTKEEPRNKFFHNIFKEIRNAVYVNKEDSINKASILNTKSEEPFLRYRGRIIRHIRTQELGFEKIFEDTSSTIKYFGTRILNSLHTDTRSWVIRNNIFIRENSALNPFEIADNERYLRSLEFIQDARILVRPIRGVKDSVDLLIVTKDLFSITGGIEIGGFNSIQGKIAENNFLGMAQKIQFTGLVDRQRVPHFGYEFLYTKTSIANTFLNATVGYTLINTGISKGNEDEKSLFFRLDRPLLSPFAHLAGGLELSTNLSENDYRKPDSLFYHYKYNDFDVWAGYNLGYNSFSNRLNNQRSRNFLAFRYLNLHYSDMPKQVGDRFDPIYNSRQALLGEFTVFKQDFYKTNYIYGFGTTEDVPYGYNIAFTGGWYKQLDLERPYAGVNINQYVTNDKGEFIQYFFRSGAFWHKGKAQDVSILLGGNYYSKLHLYNTFKVRHYIKFSFSKLIKRVTSEPLRIDNSLGLQYFRSDSVLGNQRLSLYAETFAFIRYKLFGFQFAPFVFGDLSLMTPEHVKLFSSNLYSGVGGGIRTRNENLVFGTIELRFSYFPRPAERMNPISLSFRSNIRFRFNNRYVKAPDFIQLNTEDAFNIY